jgi:hypothetical protein
MRNGQNKQRMRGRNNNNNNNHRKSQNPMTRVYESNGPDVKIRGTPSHIAEKYMQLARDAHTSGDPVAAENYYQHAEHYFRLIATAQEQFRQSNPHFTRPENEMRGAADDIYDEGDEDDAGQPQPMAGNGGDTPFGTREPQPYLPPDAQPFPPQPQPQQPQPQTQQFAPRERAPFNPPQAGGDIERLPSFITGGGQQPQQGQPAPSQQGFSSNGGNAPHDNQGGDRFPLHRRRRRHRGPRPDLSNAPQAGGEVDESRRGE